MKMEESVHWHPVTHGRPDQSAAVTVPGDPAQPGDPGSPQDPDAPRDPAGRTKRERRWRMPWLSLLIAFVCLVGTGLLLYPSTAAWWAQYNQTRAIVNLTKTVDGIGPEARNETIEEAVAYNEVLATGATVIGANQRIPTSDGAGDAQFDYDALLAADPFGLMARIKIPVIDVDLPIYHGTSDETLLEGVGHLEGTALPVGGESTHSVLTAHRGLASATLFSDLDRVGVGDRFVIEVFGEVLTYEVMETQIVEPEDTQTLMPQAGRDLITLVTCTPVGINSHRILVTGERVFPTPLTDIAAAGRVPEVPRFPWWAVIAGSTILLLAVYVWRTGRVRPAGAGKRRRDDEDPAAPIEPSAAFGTNSTVADSLPVASVIDNEAPQGIRRDPP